jgi:hypothetical protein
MILIAHRGNTTGPKPHLENSPDYIDLALEDGFSVEVDLWCVDDALYFGHDNPQYLVDPEYLMVRKQTLWIHCKNKEAFSYCLKNKLHCFWHNVDDYTMTNWGYVWAYPGKEPVNQLTVLVMPENIWPTKKTISLNAFGACSDWVGEIRDYINRV